MPSAKKWDCPSLTIFTAQQLTARDNLTLVEVVDSGAHTVSVRDTAALLDAIHKLRNAEPSQVGVKHPER